MNRNILIGAIAAAVAVFALSGCDTFQSRAKEKSAVYQSLPPDTQQRLQHGRISVGDTQDMVYIALGYPDEVREVTSVQGNQTVWIYRTYWQQYEGTQWVGWHRVIVPAPGGHGYVIYHEPVTTDVYRTHVDEVIRVVFQNNIVQSVEQKNR